MVKKLVFFLWWETGVLFGKLFSFVHEFSFRFSYTGFRGKLVLREGNSFSMPVSRRYSLGTIEIGDHFLCGDRVMIVDSDFHGIAPDRNCQESNYAPVKIGNNVWLGTEVTVLKGVMIGDNAVIGAKSLVTKDIPPNCLAVGIPAKVIRKI